MIRPFDSGNLWTARYADRSSVMRGDLGSTYTSCETYTHARGAMKSIYDGPAIFRFLSTIMAFDDGEIFEVRC